MSILFVDMWSEILSFASLYERLKTFSKVSLMISTMAIPPPTRSFSLDLGALLKIKDLWNCGTINRCLSVWKYGKEIQKLNLVSMDSAKKNSYTPTRKAELIEALTKNFYNVKHIKFFVYIGGHPFIPKLTVMLGCFPLLEEIETNQVLKEMIPKPIPRLRRLRCVCHYSKYLKPLFENLEVLKLVDYQINDPHILINFLSKPNRLRKLILYPLDEHVMIFPEKSEHFHVESITIYSPQDPNKSYLQTFVNSNLHLSDYKCLKSLHLTSLGKKSRYTYMSSIQSIPQNTLPIPDGSNYIDVRLLRSLEELILENIGIFQFSFPHHNEEEECYSIKSLSIKKNYLTNIQDHFHGKNHMKFFGDLKTKFPKLISLDLSHNEFLDVLPDLSLYIAHPKQLKKLNLKLCSLLKRMKRSNKEEEVRSRDNVAPWLAKFENLEYLNIAETNITIFPDSIIGLSELRYLNISENDIFDSLPLSFGKEIYPFLKTLKMSGIRCTELPFKIGLMKELEHLDISWNKLDKLPESFISLNNIKKFICHSNTWKEMPFTIFFFTQTQKENYSSSVLQQVKSFLKNPNYSSFNGLLPDLFKNPKKYRIRNRISRTKKNDNPYPNIKEKNIYKSYATNCFPEEIIMSSSSHSNQKYEKTQMCEKMDSIMKEISSRQLYSKNKFERGNDWYGLHDGAWKPPSENRDRIKDRGLQNHIFKRVGSFQFGDISNDMFIYKQNDISRTVREMIFKVSYLGRVSTNHWSGLSRESYVGYNIKFDVDTNIILELKEEGIGNNDESD